MDAAFPLLRFWCTRRLREWRGGWRAELLLRRLVQLAPIHIDGYRTLYIDVRAGLSWQVNELIENTPFREIPHESDVQWLARKFIRPGDTAYDIGANLGLHAILFEQMVGEHGVVCAFEPHPDLAGALHKTFDGSVVRVEEIALSDRFGESTLYIPEDHSKGSLGDWRPGGRQTACQTRRLDDLVSEGKIPPPDFIKMDAEGAEPLIIAGGQQTIRKHLPVIVVEELVEATEKLGFRKGSALEGVMALGPYTAFLLHDRQLLPLTEDRPACCEIVMVPSHRL